MTTRGNAPSKYRVPLSPKIVMTWQQLSALSSGDKSQKKLVKSPRRPQTSPMHMRRPQKSPMPKSPKTTHPIKSNALSPSDLDYTAFRRKMLAKKCAKPQPQSVAPPTSPANLSDLDYMAFRKQRLAKKNHLLGNRGKAGSPLPVGGSFVSKHQFSISPKGGIDAIGKTKTATTPAYSPNDKRKSYRERISTSPAFMETLNGEEVLLIASDIDERTNKTSNERPNALLKLLLSPTNFVKNPNGQLVFDTEQPSPSTSKQNKNVMVNLISKTQPFIQLKDRESTKHNEKKARRPLPQNKTTLSTQTKEIRSVQRSTTPKRLISQTPPCRPSAQTTKTPEGQILSKIPSSSVEHETNQETSGEHSNEELRRTLEKRSARLLHAQAFRSGIDSCRASSAHINSGSNHHDDMHIHSRKKTNGVAVFVRKRPLFGYEEDRGDFDIISFGNNHSDSDSVIVHSCNMHADMKNKLVSPMSFLCSAAFDQHYSNAKFYQHIASPMVQSVLNGGIYTILMYGQTGSGKTHTMGGIEERAVDELFQSFANKDYSTEVTLHFVELAGKSCRDLLDAKTSNVKIVDVEDGSVTLCNATRKVVKSPDELSRLLQTAKRQRATEATDENGVSSRSHAVCRITVTSLTETTKRRGVLTLVDCAASERRGHSLYPSCERQKDNVEINASLFSLKECIRARAAKEAHIPYRSSNLTHILRETLQQEDAQICVVATIAPNATDTEHTLETLKAVSKLVGTECQI